MHLRMRESQRHRRLVSAAEMLCRRTRGTAQAAAAARLSCFFACIQGLLCCCACT